MNNEQIKKEIEQLRERVKLLEDLEELRMRVGELEKQPIYPRYPRVPRFDQCPACGQWYQGTHVCWVWKEPCFRPYLSGTTTTTGTSDKIYLRS